ncbi:MAG: hypothetical protein QXY42_07005 [Candidatus Bathyarchaeia archaeon]
MNDRGLEFAVKDYLPFSPWEHNEGEGGNGALLLRFAGCNLRCYLCYAQAYAYLGSKSSRRVITTNLEGCIGALESFRGKVGWGRIQGGEPLLGRERALATANLATAALRRIIENGCPYGIPRVVIQTNGIWFSTAGEGELSDFLRAMARGLKGIEGRVAIEVSFKGPNLHDANSYAISKPDAEVPDVLGMQAKGFEKLVRAVEEIAWRDGVHSISVYPVAALGADLGSPGFIPISALLVDGEERPLFHPETWDERFGSIVKRFRGLLTDARQVYGDYMARHGMKMPLEGMDASHFQFGWISQIGRRPELREFIRKHLRADWSNRQLDLFRFRYGGLREIVPEASR